MQFYVDFNDVYDGGLLLVGPDDFDGVLMDGDLSLGRKVPLSDASGYSSFASIVSFLDVDGNPMMEVQIDWGTWRPESTRPTLNFWMDMTESFSAGFLEPQSVPADVEFSAA